MRNNMGKDTHILNTSTFYFLLIQNLFLVIVNLDDNDDDDQDDDGFGDCESWSDKDDDVIILWLWTLMTMTWGEKLWRCVALVPCRFPQAAGMVFLNLITTIHHCVGVS